MAHLRPRSWGEALALRAAHPEAVPVSGGTDLMVRMNLAGHRPAALLDLSAVPGLAEWSDRSAWIRVGPAMTYTAMVRDLAEHAPALARASRGVGSPQIRNRGTIGGNLGTASPAGDCHPALLATRATIEVESVRGERLLPAREFYLGPRRSMLAPDELIKGVLIPKATAPQEFAKVGARNAMVIAVGSFALALHADEQRVGTGIGSAAPTPVIAGAAERYLDAELADGDYWEKRRPLPDVVHRRFAELVVTAADPIDDIRSTAAYRRHALGVLAYRALRWCWTDFLKGWR
ncbi:carbon-monoxide dehydrogenase medium subunit [Actinorhabdospora filicis]|uniref:Carbon-monoxide dehydrogenase medium subunit n=1 Tax=Actinorhabdospora filicis TaxID=1785913 RepID=A0A9W6SJT6_9ACTN|nr:FAD binding domain-containing protein [Actinorhabdospora filicis]GLZ77553.1 carbon-monoxide dehydrogenase medium subunit [Actinorhabdospora filicis]